MVFSLWPQTYIKHCIAIWCCRVSPAFKQSTNAPKHKTLTPQTSSLVFRVLCCSSAITNDCFACSLSFWAMLNCWRKSYKYKDNFKNKSLFSFPDRQLHATPIIELLGDLPKHAFLKGNENVSGPKIHFKCTVLTTRNSLLVLKATTLTALSKIKKYIRLVCTKT